MDDGESDAPRTRFDRMLILRRSTFVYVRLRL